MGGGTAVYELTHDTSTGVITLEASFNDLVASGGGVVHLDQSEIVGQETHIYAPIMAFGVSAGSCEARFTMLGEECTLTATSADDWMSTSGGVTPPAPEPEPEPN